ncbi:MAG: ATP-binding cassette domain-containing protein [Oscillospiraceae bacterium]|nr:ATP-binding cassette domain-containing protein [Oscillospiraceae bacterium]
MIEIGMNHIVKNYGFNNVLTNANLEILTGNRTAIVGRNGTGKTTLFKIITGEETADKGAVTIRKGASVGYLEQIPALLESDMTVEKVLSDSFAEIKEYEDKLNGLEKLMAEETDSNKLDKIMNEYSRTQNLFIAMDGYEMTEQFNKIVSGFYLRELLERPFNVLSGGQKTIVKLAATILKRPDILLLDEPTNHLDIKTLEWFENYLSKYKGTAVIISHDRYFLDRVANKTIILDGGECESFNGNYSFSLKEQEEQLLIEFENYKNQQKKIEAMKAAIKRYRDWGDRGNNPKFFRKAKELEKRLEKMEIIEKPQLEKQKIPIQFIGSRTGHDVLMLENFSLTLGENQLFDCADMQVYEKEKVCLMGDNGTGKTSLILAAMGINDFSGFQGKITVNPSAKIGYIPQEIRFENEKNTVIDEFKKEHICSENEARNILARYFFFGESVYKRVGALSGGEKVLLKLASLIQNEINFLILDEPTNHIDIETREMLEEALSNYKGTLLFISHDRYFINKIAGRIINIQDKKLISFNGNYDEYKNYTRKI